MIRKTHFILPVLAVFLFLGVAPIIQADPGGNKAPNIYAAIPEYEENLLIIFGTDLFCEMTPPTVTLAGEEYLASVTEDGEVLVDVNLNLISPGDYLLVLKPDHRKPAKAEFMLTLGAGQPNETGPVPYLVDTNFFWVDDDHEFDTHIDVFCHPGDISAGGSWYASPDESTRFVGGGSGRTGYSATFKNTETEFGVTH